LSAKFLVFANFCCYLTLLIQLCYYFILGPTSTTIQQRGTVCRKAERQKVIAHFFSIMLILY